MKKLLSVLILIALCISCMTVMIACEGETETETETETQSMEEKIAGVYEMTDISGSMTANGQTISLSKDLYEYYLITLNEDGTATVESKAAGNDLKVEQEATWEWDDGKIELKSTTQGITVVEELDWKDNVITYKATQSAQGLTITMNITLTKK